MNSISRYALIYYDVPKKLGISLLEYIFLDMVDQLSKKGWCYKTVSNIADDMSMSRNGVQKMKDRMIKAGLLIKNEHGHLRVTDTYHSVVRTYEKPYNSVTKRTTQLYGTVPLSGTKNTIENNKEYTNNMVREDHRGKPSANKDRIAAILRARDYTQLKANA